MGDLDPRGLAAALHAVEGQGLTPDGGTPHGWRCEHPDRYPDYCKCPAEIAESAVTAYLAALPHPTADDLRDTPAGRALVAQGKSLGWDDAIGELRKGQGLHRALAGTLSTRKPSYEEATEDVPHLTMEPTA